MVVVVVFAGVGKGSSSVGTRWEEENRRGGREDRRVWSRGGVVQLVSVGIHLGLSSEYDEIKFNIPGELYGEAQLYYEEGFIS